jgi:hypothetical protein
MAQTQFCERISRFRKYVPTHACGHEESGHGIVTHFLCQQRQDVISQCSGIDAKQFADDCRRRGVVAQIGYTIGETFSRLFCFAF